MPLLAQSTQLIQIASVVTSNAEMKIGGGDIAEGRYPGGFCAERPHCRRGGCIGRIDSLTESDFCNVRKALFEKF